MLDDEDLQRVYQWVDEIPLSRPKRNIARDFSDGVLTAEIVHHYFPKLIEIHNYPAANSYAQKNYNWKTLNDKVFKRMSFQMTKEDMDNLCNCEPQAVEKMLSALQKNMAKYGARKSAGEADPPQQTGAKPYKPPPKPEVKAPTVPKAPGAARATKASVVAQGAPAGHFAVHAGEGLGVVDPSMARLEGLHEGGGSSMRRRTLS